MPGGEFPTFSNNAITAEMKVGHRAWPKKRIRLAFHIITGDPSKPDYVAPERLTTIVRKRTLRWVRRVFAQANMAPRIVDIEVIGPEPPRNMLGICGYVPASSSNRNEVKSKKPSGQDKATAQSKIFLQFSTLVEVELTSGDDLAAVLAKAKDAVEAAGLTTTTATSDPYKQVVITKTIGGAAVAVRATHNDAALDKQSFKVGERGKITVDPRAPRPSGRDDKAQVSKVKLEFPETPIEITVPLLADMEFSAIADAVETKVNTAGIGFTVRKTTKLEKKVKVVDALSADVPLGDPATDDKGLPGAAVSKNGDAPNVLDFDPRKKSTGLNGKGNASTLTLNNVGGHTITVNLIADMDSAALATAVKDAINSAGHGFVATVVDTPLTEVGVFNASNQPVTLKKRSHDDARLLPEVLDLSGDNHLLIKPRSSRKPQGGSNIKLEYESFLEVDLTSAMSANDAAAAIVSKVNSSGRGYTAVANPMAAFGSLRAEDKLHKLVPLKAITYTDTVFGKKLAFDKKAEIVIPEVGPAGITLDKASGLDGGGAPSKMILEYAPTLEVPLDADMTFPAIAVRVAEKVNEDPLDLGYTAKVARVPQPDPTLEGSGDVYFYDAEGEPLALRDAIHNDARMDPKVLQKVRPLDDDGDDMVPGGDVSQRFILRLGESWGDDRIDIFLVPKANLKGRAYPEYIEQDPLYRPDGDEAGTGRLRRAAYLGYSARDAGNKVVFDEEAEISPFTLPHEIGHVLADTAHNGAEGDLMRGSWSERTALHAEKRIYSAPLFVGSYDMGSTEGHTAEREDQDMVDDMHERGGRHLTEDW
jgi:hypothetical protein